MQVGFHRPEIAGLVELELDILAEQPAQQNGQFGQHVAERERLRPQGLLARESEQLAHQARGPVGVLLDVHDVLEGRVGRPMVHQRKSEKPMIAVSMLLKSWAMPPASWPTACIFWPWAICISSARCSVVSMA